MVHDWIAEGAKIDGNDPGKPIEPATPVASGPEPITGEWENNEGRIITATLLRVEGPNAILKITDGREVPYPIEKLSATSQAKIREFAESSGG